MARRPVLDSYEYYLYSFYQDLSASRSASMAGPLPIPVSEILAYCELFKIQTIHERAQVFRSVTSLDNVYLTHVSKKNAK